MEKAIVLKNLEEIADNTDYSTGEILFSLMSKLRVSKKSELLTLSNKDILSATESLKKDLMSKDERMTDKEWDTWVHKVSN